MAEKTKMTPEWVKRVWDANPCTQLDNGNIRLLARLAFVQALEPRMKDGVDKGYGVVLLIPDLALIGSTALAPLQNAAQAMFQEKAPLALTNADLMEKYHQPFKKQGTWIDKKTGALYDGFVPGRYAISANSSKTKPPVVDQNGAPIIDKARIYSGCWGIVAVKAGWINNTENQGPTFYLQSVMVVADDENLGGVGVSNPQQDFAGVKVDPSVSPAAAFGLDMATAGNAAAPTMASLLD